MTLLCFLLDLRAISPPSLCDVKQALLQLANLYVLSPDRAERKPRKGKIPFLEDQIALCYLHWSRNSFSSFTELKIVYRPGERFSVRDFHHAVNSISLDSVLPDVSSMDRQTGSEEIPLTDLLNNNALYKWGSDDLPKKVIIICSLISTSSESLRRNIMDAADKCITVEFVVLEHAEANLHYDDTEKLMQFSNSVCDLENCVIRSYLLDSWVLNGLVKKWFQELEDVAEDPIQAVIFFKNCIFNSVNQIHCSLFPSSTHIVDGFRSCKTCRCHGYPIDTAIKRRSNSTCPVTLDELGASDLIDNVARIGEQAVLFLPSFEGCANPQRISAPITLSVVECTSLASLSEGLIMGTSFYVTPSCHDTECASDESDKVDPNVQTFHGLCKTLFLLDQGLVCSSTCNTETMQDGTFDCYYILQPSEGGPMLLRRLASSEEILPIPDTTQASDISIPEEVENSIRTSLKQLELRDYNPLQHERGVHAKFNWLVKESLQFGSICAHSIPKSLELNMLNDLQQPPSTQASEVDVSPEQNKDNTSSSTAEWEKLLIVDDLNSCYSPHSKTKTLDLGVQTKPLDEKTSRILERLEAPKQQTLKAALPSITKNLLIEQIKKPLVPFNSNSSQPLKPNFQKLKRKQC